MDALQDLNHNDFWLTPNINLRDLACKGDNCCGHAVKPDKLVVDILQKLFTAVGVCPINSGYRCAKHNAETSGSSAVSQHMLGEAIDVGKKPGLSVDVLADTLSQLGAKRIGKYEWGVHFSPYDLYVDGKLMPRRWQG